MKKIKKVFFLVPTMLIFFIACSLTSLANENIELNLGESREVSFSSQSIMSLIWQSNNTSVVTCSGDSYRIGSSAFDRTYFCDFNAVNPGTTTVTVLNELTNSVVQTYTVTVSKYNTVQCVGKEFGISITTSINQAFSFALEDGTILPSRLSGTSTITIGSYTRYTKTYAISVDVVGEHNIAISGSSGSSLSYSANIIDHSWGTANTTLKPTCTETGINIYTCSKCNTTKQESVDSLGGHLYSDTWTTDVEPTCSQVGEQSRHCIRCSSRTDIAEIALLDHTPGEWETIIAAKCTQAGVKVKKCIICKEPLEEETIPKSDHDYKLITDKVATCGTIGSQHDECSVCGDKQNIVEIPATGDHNYKIIVDQNATCNTEGRQHEECTVCHDTKDAIEISAIGHIWNSTETIDINATCIKNGQKSIHWQNCATTKNSVTIPATGHSFGEWKVTVAPTYSTEGKSERICLNCSQIESKSISVLSQPETEAPSSNGEKPILRLNTTATLPIQVKQKCTEIKVDSILKDDKVISWNSSNPKVVSVTSSGKLTAKKTGTVTITCTTKKGATASFKVKVQKTSVKLKKLSVNKRSVVLRLKKGKNTFKIEAAKKPLTYKGKITYNSANKKIATVNSKGKITAKKVGKTKIYVKCGSKKVTIKVTVKK